MSEINDQIKNAGSEVKEKLTEGFSNAKSFLTGEQTNPLMKLVSEVVLALLVLSAIFLIIEGLRKLIKRFTEYNKNTPWLEEGTRNAREQKIVYQDPKNDNAITIYRSRNEDGLEFSYSTWLFIDDWNYKNGDAKHVFHKGNPSSWPNRAPAVYLDKTQNKLLVYMNTFLKINELVEIDNIPIKKWFHFALVVRERTMDVFINGFLKKRTVLSSLPKQNFGNVYISQNGGFSGFISRFRYFDFALPYAQLDAMIRKGPAMVPCVDTGEMPPYLATNWWQNRY
jgi:hypothetical protein